MKTVAHRQRDYLDMTWWDPYVETASIADEATYLRRKFRQDVADAATGLSQEALSSRLDEIVAVAGAPFYESCAIAAGAILAGIDRFIAQGKMRMGKLSTAIDCIRQQPTAIDSSRLQPTAIDSEKSRRRRDRLAKEVACVERLRAGAPETAYDVMMFVWLYFMFSEHLDGIQCRSLTELDVFLTPYYDADIAAGRTTEAEFREQLKHFLWQWGSIANYWNQPVGLGGTGWNVRWNDLARAEQDAYIRRAENVAQG